MCIGNSNINININNKKKIIKKKLSNNQTIPNKPNYFELEENVWSPGLSL